MPRNVEVVTRDLADLDRLPKRVIINHDREEHRIWLGKHCFWAMRNNHSVHTAPTELHVTFIDKKMGK